MRQENGKCVSNTTGSFSLLNLFSYFSFNISWKVLVKMLLNFNLGTLLNFVGERWSCGGYSFTPELYKDILMCGVLFELLKTLIHPILHQLNKTNS